MVVIWEDMVDKKYPVRVFSTTDRYAGTFEVLDPADHSKVLFTKPVGVSYGAPFGPDAADVSDWQNAACEFVDKYEENNG